MLSLAIIGSVFANILIFSIGIDVRWIQILWLLWLLAVIAHQLIKGKVYLSVFGKILFYYVLFLLVASLFSKDRVHSIVETLHVLGLVFIALILEYRIKTPKELRQAVVLTVVSGAIFAFAGLFQRIFGFSLIPQITMGTGGLHINTSGIDLTDKYVTGAVRSNALFFGIVATGCFAAQMSLLATAFVASSEPNRNLRTLSLFTIAGCIVLVLFTYSRSGTLAMAFVWMVYLLIKRGDKKWLFLLGTLAVVSYFIGSTFSDRLTSSTGVEDSTNAQHLVLWFSAIRFFLNNPFTGIGPGMFQQAVGAGGIVNVWGLNAYISHDGLMVHNIILQSFAEAGVGAGIMLTSFIVYLTYSLFKCNRYLAKKISLSDYNLHQAIFLAVMVGFIVNLISNFWIREAFWITIGLGMASVRICLKQKGQVDVVQ